MAAGTEQGGDEDGLPSREDDNKRVTTSAAEEDGEGEEGEIEGEREEGEAAMTGQKKYDPNDQKREK